MNAAAEKSSRQQKDPERQARVGAAYALGAFGIWGFIPVYFKAVAEVTLIELLAHRTLWSMMFVAATIIIADRHNAVRALLWNPRLLVKMFGTAVILAVNWLIFIWAIANGQVLQSSLGYYINPLVNVLLGYFFLNERLNGLQMGAVALAAVGIAIPVVGLGEFPWIALSLAGTFGMYGLLRKTADIDAVTGLFIETVLLAPGALVFLVYWNVAGGAVFTERGLGLDALIVASGVATALPLILFTQAAQRLRLGTVGFFQYLAPTCHFALAVFGYGEDFTPHHLATFALIWTAIAIYITDTVRRSKKRRLGERA